MLATNEAHDMSNLLHDELRDRARSAVEEVGALLGLDSVPEEATNTFEGLAAVIEFALDVLAEGLADGDDRVSDVAQAARMVLVLNRLLAEIHAHARNQRLRALSNVTEALARLRSFASSTAIVDAAADEVSRSCGFDRCVLFRLDQDELVAEAIYPAVAGTSAMPTIGALSQDCVERAVLRSGEAALLGRERGRRSLLAEQGWPYPLALAPVIVHGRSLGLLAASRDPNSGALEAIDRDALAAYAAGLGDAIERSVLVAQLQDQREKVLQLVKATEAIAGHLSAPPLDIRGGIGRTPPDPSTALLIGRPSSTATLSEREREVMEVVCTGATNNDIAKLLFISEETVKTHVKQLLRKLGAANRVEAVALYLRASSTPLV